MIDIVIQVRYSLLKVQPRIPDEVSCRPSKKRKFRDFDCKPEDAYEVPHKYKKLNTGVIYQSKPPKPIQG